MKFKAQYLCALTLCLPIFGTLRTKVAALSPETGMWGVHKRKREQKGLSRLVCLAASWEHITPCISTGSSLVGGFRP